MIKYERTITDEEQKILLNDLLDINKWIDGMILGKINNCKKRMAIAYRELLKKEGATTVPSSDDFAIKQYLLRSDYKNRLQRETQNNGN